jgi:hypothetical protein
MSVPVFKRLESILALGAHPNERGRRGRENAANLNYKKRMWNGELVES